MKESVDFGLRGSYRQPFNATDIPEPRAPRFLRQIVDEIGAVDVWPLESTTQTIDPDTIQRFMKLLESESRVLPVIAISEDDQTGSVFTDPDKVARLLAGTAQVFRLDPYACWSLSRAWGNDWSVFRGAIRCYLPALDRSGDKFKHILWLPEYIARLDANLRNGSTNSMVSRVFAQVTARFETRPLLTPSIVRRSIAEESRRSAGVTAETAAGAKIGIEERREAELLIRPICYATFLGHYASKEVWRRSIRGSCRNRH